MTGTWVDVTRRGKTPAEAVVNIDRVDAIITYPWGTRLVWHQTSPRCEWDVMESIDELIGERG